MPPSEAKPIRSSRLAVFPLLAATLFTLGGCEKKVPEAAPSADADGATAQHRSALSAWPAALQPDEETVVAMRLDMVFRLGAEFPEAFPGSPDEVCAFIRKHAFVEGDPGDAVRLGIDQAKRLLSAHFEGPASIQNQARLSGWLRNGGWWKRPGDKAPTVVQRVDPTTEKAREKSLSFRHALLQLGNDAARRAALNEMAAALSGTDPIAKLAALNAMDAATQLEFDRAKFRELLLPLLEDRSGTVRGSALGSLLGCNPAPEDLQRALAMMNDPAPEVKKILAFAIQRLAKGDLTGQAGAAVATLLDQSAENDRRSVLGALWGSNYSPELEEKLVGMATPFAGPGAYDAMYYSLSTQQNKGEKTVDLLISCLSHPDQGNVAGRALWGLGQGVNPEQQPKVAAAVLEFFIARSWQRDDCLRILSNYGRETEAQRLEELLGKQGLPRELRKQMESTVTAIRRRALGR